MARRSVSLLSFLVLGMVFGCSSSTNGPGVAPADGEVASYLEAHPELKDLNVKAEEGEPKSVDD